MDAYGKIPIRFIDVELELSLRIEGQLGINAYDAYILEGPSGKRVPSIFLTRSREAAKKEEKEETIGSKGSAGKRSLKCEERRVKFSPF